MLISAMVGIDLRTTLDMDATIKGFELSEAKLKEVLNEIILIDVDDGMKFEIIGIRKIMEESDYSGYRVTIKGFFEKLYVNFTIDISTGDVITPREMKYKFKLLFEDRNIEILAYNLETVISEKVHAIISRGVANTRARDFYDMYILTKFQSGNYNKELVGQAIINKFKSRDTEELLDRIDNILIEIENSDELRELWDNYTKKFTYAEGIIFDDVISSVKEVISYLYEEESK